MNCKGSQIYSFIILYKITLSQTLMNNAEISSLLPISQFLPLTIKSKLSNNQLSTTSSISKQTAANTKVIGNYLLGKLLGKGTFGEVHLALHIPTNQKVAVKIIDKKKMPGRDIARTHKQIEIMKKIHHRHIVQLYQILQTKKSVLLFQEHLPNGQLFKEIINKKKLSQIEACRYFKQIISALEYLHKNKIAHRDLKPENILIDFDNQIKLIDFGLSTEYEKDMASFCGSPCYAAPQIISGKKGYNPFIADLWSCGIILFTMVAGYLPFCQTNVNLMFKKILAGSYKMPDFLSASVKNLIENLLTTNPSQRMSIKSIKNHQWFNQIPTELAYGINKNEYIPYSNEIICNLQKMGIDTNYFKDNDNKDLQKNKYTASYFILMKKLIKNQELIPQYIGCDYFNPNLIMKKYHDKSDQESDTRPISFSILQTTNDPYNQIDNMIPPEPDNPNSQYPSLGYVLEEQKAINQQQLMKMVKNIYDIIFNQLFKSQNLNKNHLLRQKRQILLQNQFYKGNLNNKKVFLNRFQTKSIKQNKSERQEKQLKYPRLSLNKSLISRNTLSKNSNVDIQGNQSSQYTSNKVIKLNIKNKTQNYNKYAVYLIRPIFKIHQSTNNNKFRILQKRSKKDETK